MNTKEYDAMHDTMGAQERSEVFMSFHGAMLLRDHGCSWLIMAAHQCS